MTRIRIALFLAACFLLGVGVRAVADPPKLTDAEKAKIEIVTLKAQLARAIADADAVRIELAQVRTAYNAIAIEREAAAPGAALEAAHPGTKWNPKTGTLDAAPEKPPAQGTP